MRLARLFCISQRRVRRDDRDHLCRLHMIKAREEWRTMRDDHRGVEHILANLYLAVELQEQVEARMVSRNDSLGVLVTLGLVE